MAQFEQLLAREARGIVLIEPRPRGVARCSCARAGGFTLIELMITITLLGILIALGLPGLMDMIHNAQVRTVADALQTGLRTAQTEAVRRNRQVALVFTNSTPAAGVPGVVNGKNWAAQTVPPLSGLSGETNEFIAGGALGDVAAGVLITPTPAMNAICFNSGGRPIVNADPATGSGALCAGGTAQFDVNLAGGNAARPLRVYVDLGGRVRLCDPKRPTLSATSPDGCPP